LVHFDCFGIVRSEKSGNPDWWERHLERGFRLGESARQLPLQLFELSLCVLPQARQHGVGVGGGHRGSGSRERRRRPAPNVMILQHFGLENWRKIGENWRKIGENWRF
jgi:hypothetical protein